MVTRPNASTAAFTTASRWSSLVTSQASAAALPPAAQMAAATSSAVAGSRSLTSTDAPASARRSAMARPMPAPAPVTTATSPERSSSESMGIRGLLSHLPAPRKWQTYRHVFSPNDLWLAGSEGLPPMRWQYRQVAKAPETGCVTLGAGSAATPAAGGCWV